MTTSRIPSQSVRPNDPDGINDFPDPTYSVPPVFCPDDFYPYDEEPWAGTPTKIEWPGASSYGWLPGMAVPAQCLNHFFHAITSVGQPLKDYMTADATRKIAFLTKVLAHIGQVPALKVLHFATASTNVDAVKYLPAKRTWYALGSTADKFQRTTDYMNWPGTSELSGGALTSSILSDFDVDDLGRIVAFTNTADAYVEYDGTNWTKHTGFLGAGPFGAATRGVSVNHDPVSGLWSVAFKTSAGAPPKCWYGASRVAWTQVSLPFPNGSEVCVSSNGIGMLVAMGRSGTDVYFSSSTDGGVTWSTPWSDATGIALSLTFPLVRPVWTGTHWVAIVSTNSGSLQSRVYASTDGVSWAQTTYLSNTMIRSVAGAGLLWLGATSVGELAVSIDQGQTWRYLDHKLPSAGTAYVYFNGTRFVISGVDSMAVTGGCGVGGAIVT